MNNKMPLEELVPKLAVWVQKKAKTPREQSALQRQLFDGLAAALLEEQEAFAHLAAPNAVVEVVDGQTGTLHRRYLELAVEENSNGIRLVGEDMGGNAAQIVFLSNTALAQMHELQGEGPDEPRCGGNE